MPPLPSPLPLLPQKCWATWSAKDLQGAHQCEATNGEIGNRTQKMKGVIVQKIHPYTLRSTSALISKRVNLWQLMWHSPKHIWQKRRSSTVPVWETRAQFSTQSGDDLLNIKHLNPLHHQIIQRSYFILFWWPTKKGGRQSLSSFILLRFRILFFFLGDVVGRSPTAQNDLHAPRIFAAHVAEGTSQVVPQTETTPKPSTCHVWDIEVDFGWVWGW